jgi:ketosteroid isomerase-like protein
MNLSAQTNVKSIQNEIDKTVWKVFQQAFENLDVDALNRTYADDILRVTPNGIDTEDNFKLGNVEHFEALKVKEASIKLDFWLDDRKTNATTSYEVGFYRIATTINELTTYSYGQFHIVLKNISGKWLITQDWDTTTINGNTIGKEDFDKKESLKF